MVPLVTRKSIIACLIDLASLTPSFPCLLTQRLKSSSDSYFETEESAARMKINFTNIER